jgi:hypothetical protein
MSADLDELFGGGGQAEARTRLVYSLVAFGLIFTLLGLACTTAPGGLMVLVAWVIIDKESSRIESGYLPTDLQPQVDRARKWTYLALLGVIALFMLQLILLCQGFYEWFWGALLQLLVPLIIDASPTGIQL